jgi:prevent-host-death family protein
MTIVVRVTRMVMSRGLMVTWGVAQAKAQFSEVIEKAMTEGPQEVTKGGKDAVVIVSKREWLKKKATTSSSATSGEAKRSAADFWLNSPLRGSGMKLKPIKGKLSEVEF